jgi:hypothetical protein
MERTTSLPAILACCGSHTCPSLWTTLQVNHLTGEPRCRWTTLQVNHVAGEPRCRWTTLQVNHVTGEPCYRWTTLQVNHVTGEPRYRSTMLQVNHVTGEPCYRSTTLQVNHVTGKPRYRWTMLQATKAFCSDTPLHLVWASGTIICFSTGQGSNTPPGCARDILPRRKVMECCIRWPGLHNHPISTQLRWFGLDCRVGLQSDENAANKCLAYVGTPSRRLEKHSRWSWLREC